MGCLLSVVYELAVSVLAECEGLQKAICAPSSSPDEAERVPACMHCLKSDICSRITSLMSYVLAVYLFDLHLGPVLSSRQEGPVSRTGTVIPPGSAERGSPQTRRSCGNRVKTGSFVVAKGPIH